MRLVKSKDKFFFTAILFIILFYQVKWFGVDIPFYDQWDSEANLYIRFVQGSLKFEDFLQPHNEHRIVFTRILGLSSFILNNGWSVKFNLYLQNALLAINFYLLVSLFLSKEQIHIKERKWILISVLLGFIIPYNWENLLWSFQNQFYFSTLFALWTLHQLKEAGGIRNFFGVFILAFFTSLNVASGLLIFLVIFIFCLMSWFENRETKDAFFSLLSLAFFIIAVFLTPKVDYHNNLKADSISQFLKAFIGILEFPYFYFNGFLVIAIVSSLFALSRRENFNISILRNNPSFLLFIWSILSVSLIAYGRGNSNFYSSRFQFTFYLLGISSIVLIDYIFEVLFPRFRKYIKFSLLGIYSLLIFAHFVYKEQEKMIERIQIMLHVRDGVLKYVETRNEDYIYWATHPESKRVIEVLNNEKMQIYYLFLKKKGKKDV